MLADIYSSAREARKEGLDLEVVAGRIAGEAAWNGARCESIFLPTFEDIAAHLRSHLEKGDVLVTMGAGDVRRIGYGLVGKAR